MKKTIAIILCLMLCVSVFAACGKDDPPPPPTRERTLDPANDVTPRSEPPAARPAAPSGFYTVVSWEDDGEDVMDMISMMAGLMGIEPEEFCFIEFPGGNVCRMYMFEEDPEEGTYRIDGDKFVIAFEGGEIDGTIAGNRITLEVDGSTMVFQQNSSFTGASSPSPGGGLDPFPPPAPSTGSPIFPSVGGSVRVDGSTEFTFVPNQTGFWEFYTSDNGNSDPLLEIYDAAGRLLADDDDGGEGYNALIGIDLVAGQTYKIHARFWASGSGSFMLTGIFYGSHIGSGHDLPSEGGSVIVAGEREFPFTPNRSGTWEFRTSDNGDSDPMLEIYDSNRRLLDSDDDGGDGLNALITINLEAGQTYYIAAKFWWGGTGDFVLTARHMGGANELPGGGGTVQVNGETEFAFVPSQSGRWEFRTSNNGNSDPVLEIYDSNRRMIAEDDDGGDGLNSLISIDLNAGSTYYVVAKTWWGDSGGSYTLTVTRR